MIVCRRSHGSACGAVAALLAALCLAAGPLAAASLIEVDTAHPDLMKLRAAAPPPGLAPAERSRLDKLKLPVLLPDPAATRQAAGVEVAPKPTILTDENDPVWYHAETDLGGVSISVEADLRVQHEFPEGYAVYGDKGASGAAPEASEPLHGAKEEEGMANLVGQVTVTRYNVPYTITVTCDAPDTDKCRAAERMARDGSILKLFAAPKAE